LGIFERAEIDGGRLRQLGDPSSIADFDVVLMESGVGELRTVDVVGGTIKAWRRGVGEILAEGGVFFAAEGGQEPVTRY
jgi:hypothetical protein